MGWHKGKCREAEAEFPRSTCTGTKGNWHGLAAVPCPFRGKNDHVSLRSPDPRPESRMFRCGAELQRWNVLRRCATAWRPCFRSRIWHVGSEMMVINSRAILARKGLVVAVDGASQRPSHWRVMTMTVVSRIYTFQCPEFETPGHSNHHPHQRPHGGQQQRPQLANPVPAPACPDPPSSTSCSVMHDCICSPNCLQKYTVTNMEPCTFWQWSNTSANIESDGAFSGSSGESHSGR